MAIPTAVTKSWQTTTLGVIAGLMLLLSLTGCKADDLRKQADIQQGVAEHGERAAATVEQAVAQIGTDPEQLKAWILGPLGQVVVASLPPEWKARVDGAVAAGVDAGPILLQASADIRAAAANNRQIAESLRNAADREDTAAQNFMTAATAAVSGTGPWALLATGLVGWIVDRTRAKNAALKQGKAEGAAQVSGVINTARAAVPEFDEHFNNGTGKIMAAELSMADPVVRDAVIATKINTKGGAS